MIKYFLWAFVEIAILRWLFWSVRKRISHETAMALGAFLGVTLYFQAFMNLSPWDCAVWETPVWLKVIAWGLLWLGAALALVSILTLRLKGKPPSGWEHTTRLIETGIYRWVRHPLYLAALLLVAGTVLLTVAALTLTLAILSTICFVLAARYEDHFNAKKFGEKYRQYQARSKLLIPFLF